MAKGTQRKPKLEHVEFIFRIGRPATYYNFALQRDRYDPDPYSEQLHLSFGVWCLYPDRLKGQDGEANLFGSAGLNPGTPERLKPYEPPKAVGSVVIRKRRLEVGGQLPPDVIWRLGDAMASGTITLLSAGGRWLKPSHAREIAARVGRASAAGLEHIWFDERKDDKTGQVVLEPVTYYGLQARLDSAADRAKVSKGRRIHGTRHHAATPILRSSKNLKLSQRLLGHANIQSTMRYAHASEDDLRAALGEEPAQGSDSLTRNSPEPKAGNGK